MVKQKYRVENSLNCFGFQLYGFINFISESSDEESTVVKKERKQTHNPMVQKTAALTKRDKVSYSSSSDEEPKNEFTVTYKSSQSAVSYQSLNLVTSCNVV